MLIDWFTVAAQALNFLILAWLMKRFLYRPILDAIDAREAFVAAELADAARQQTESRRERDALQKTHDDFDQQRAGLLQQARHDAEAEHKRLVIAAREAVDAKAVEHQQALLSESRALVQAVALRAQAEVFAIARRILGDLADVSLESSVCAVFVARLQDLAGQSRDTLAIALRQAGDAPLVRSCFELPLAQRRAIGQAISAAFGVDTTLRFATEPALVAGIELVVRGQKVAWTISEHLALLEQGVSDVLHERDQRRLVLPAAAGEP